MALADNATRQTLPLSLCPDCGYELDAATGVTDQAAVPSPGDLSLCLRCTTLLRFDATMHVRALSPAEFRELPEDVRAWLRQLQRVAREINRQNW
jgi:hypothetical protein